MLTAEQMIAIDGELHALAKKFNLQDAVLVLTGPTDDPAIKSFGCIHLDNSTYANITAMLMKALARYRSRIEEGVPINVNQYMAGSRAVFDTEPGKVGFFTRNQEPGAHQNGTRLAKTNSMPGDTHDDGALCTVVGSVALGKDENFMYFVEWDSHPDHIVGIHGNRLKTP